MKLAFLAPHFYNTWGGIGIYSVGLVRELALMPEMDVHVFCPDVADMKAKERISALIGPNVNIHTLCRAVDSPVFNLLFQLSVLREFPEFHKRYQFDIIHSANLVNMPDLFLRWKDLGIPIVTTAHTSFNSHVKGLLFSTRNPLRLAPHERLELVMYPALALVERHYLRKARHIISVSKAFGKILREDYGYRGEMKVIPNSVDASHFSRHSFTKQHCVRKFPVLGKVKSPVIMYAGRISRQKGIVLLLRSLKILQDAGVRFNFIVAGKGAEKDLKTFIASSGVNPENVHFFGFVENRDLACLYKSSDIFVVPSFSEHFPISLLEAMSMGCCPIGTSVGSIDEIIEHEEDGLIVPPGDPQAMASAIRRLIKDPKWRELLAEKGMKKIHAGFTANNMAMKTKAYYEEILGMR